MSCVDERRDGGVGEDNVEKDVLVGRDCCRDCLASGISAESVVCLVALLLVFVGGVLLTDNMFLFGFCEIHFRISWF